MHSCFPILDSPCVLCIGKINERPYPKVHNRKDIEFYNLWHDSEVWLYSSKLRKHRFLLPLQQYRYFKWHIPIVLRTIDLFIHIPSYMTQLILSVLCKMEYWITMYDYSSPTICNAKVSHNFLSLAKLLKTNLVVGSCLCEIHTTTTTTNTTIITTTTTKFTLLWDIHTYCHEVHNEWDLDNN